MAITPVNGLKTASYRGRQRYGGLELAQAKRLKEPERESEMGRRDLAAGVVEGAQEAIQTRSPLVDRWLGRRPTANVSLPCLGV